MKNNRFSLLIEIGGFIYWFFIKFGKTKLSNELEESKAPRNILVFCISIVILCFINYKFLNL